MFSSRQSMTSCGSGNLWTIGRATLPAGFLLIGLVSVPENRRGRRSWETRTKSLDHIQLSQWILKKAQCKIIPHSVITSLDWVTCKTQSHDANCFAHIRFYLFSFWMPWRISSNSMWAVLRLGIHVRTCTCTLAVRMCVSHCCRWSPMSHTPPHSHRSPTRERTQN